MPLLLASLPTEVHCRIAKLVLGGLYACLDRSPKGLVGLANTSKYWNEICIPLLFRSFRLSDLRHGTDLSKYARYVRSLDVESTRTDELDLLVAKFVRACQNLRYLSIFDHGSNGFNLSPETLKAIIALGPLPCLIDLRMNIEPSSESLQTAASVIEGCSSVQFVSLSIFASEDDDAPEPSQQSRLRLSKALLGHPRLQQLELSGKSPFVPFEIERSGFTALKTHATIPGDTLDFILRRTASTLHILFLTAKTVMGLNHPICSLPSLAFLSIASLRRRPSRRHISAFSEAPHLWMLNLDGRYAMRLAADILSENLLPHIKYMMLSETADKKLERELLQLGKKRGVDIDILPKEPADELFWDTDTSDGEAEEDEQDEAIADQNQEQDQAD